MKPYYDANGITVYCADNRAIDLPMADLILTDPPYSETTHTGARSAPKWSTSGGMVAPPLGIDFDSVTATDVHAMFVRFALIARRWVVSFLDWRHVEPLESNTPNGLRFVRHGIWIKPNGAPQFTGDRPGTGWESIAFLHKAGGRMRWNGGGKHGVYTCNVAHASHRISEHPNAKPFALVAELIRDFSDPGDLIVDPFGGSGVVAAAASALGRRCVLVEQNEAHCAALVFWLKHRRPARLATSDYGPLFDALEDAA